MIRASLAAFINASVLKTFYGVNAYVFQPDTNVGEIPKPSCFVSALPSGKEDLWIIGDRQRKENPRLTVTFYCLDQEQRTQFYEQFRRLIQSAFTTDFGGLTHPGIDYVADADWLRDEGDHQHYDSDQPNWFASPSPIVYKNPDRTSDPTQISSGFTIDSANGKVVFSVPNLATDVVRATYKIGIIDFVIASVDFPSLEDIANNEHRFNAVIGLDTHFYVKANASKYL